MTDEVLVVGGGIEGYVAALTAALEEPVASVRLLELDAGRFRRETGLIDLLGYTPDGEGPVREPLAALSDLPADHPYSRVGVDDVRRALSLFEEVTGYRGLDSDANALVATLTGNVKPTFLYPEGVAPGLASDDRETLLVGFERIVDFDAELAAARLNDRLSYDVRSSSITLPVEGGDEHPVERFADALDDNEELDGELPARRAVAGKTRSGLDIEPRIGFPAVLGRTDVDEVRSDLEALLQADVFEIPLGPPNLPGIRLRERLRSELDDAGVAVERDVIVDGFTTDGGRIADLDATVGREDGGDGNGNRATQKRYEAEQFVLVTGGLGAGGLRGGRERITEQVFGCHLPQPADRAEWVAERYLDDQPFARIGLDVDDELRPQGSDGTPEFENLRAAGRILGGTDAATEQSTGGVAVVTGHRAGTLAVETAIES